MSALTLVLVILGLVLLVVEAHVPTYGALGTAGIGALALGLVLLVIGSGGSLLLALAVALPFAAAGTAFGLFAVAKARAATRRQPRCGAEGLVGRIGVVQRPLEPLGQVSVDGALWRARRSWADEDGPPPGRGDAVVVDQVRGLTLSVRRAEDWEVDP
jgi:membrane-bound serine protease (ClpP class)